MDLKVGDIVKLKTGGPKMTVNRVGPITTDLGEECLMKDEVETVWFSKHQSGVSASDTNQWDFACTHRFGAEALEKCDP